MKDFFILGRTIVMKTITEEQRNGRAAIPKISKIFGADLKT